MKAIFHFCKKEFFVILILAYCVRGDAQTWNLVWSDEFDSGSVNTANWTYNTGGGGWGNNELESDIPIALKMRKSATEIF